MKQTKRVISFFVLFSLIFLLFSPIRSEAKTTSQQKAVKSQVIKYLKSVRKCDYKTVNQLLTKKAKKQFVRHDAQIEKVIKILHKSDFKYEIKKIKVSGKKATITVRVKYYDAYNDYCNAFTDTLKKLRSEYIKNPSKKWTDKYIYKKWSYYLKENYYSAVDECYDDDFYWDMCIRKKTITISMVKEKNKWKISEYNKQMQDMTDCRIQSAHKYILKHSDEFKDSFILGY